MTTEEKINKAKGAVKEGVGKVTGDIRMEREGVTEKTAAKLKDVVEDVKGAVEGTIDGIKNVVNKEK